MLWKVATSLKFTFSFLGANGKTIRNVAIPRDLQKRFEGREHLFRSGRFSFSSKSFWKVSTALGVRLASLMCPIAWHDVQVDMLAILPERCSFGRSASSHAVCLDQIEPAFRRPD